MNECPHLEKINLPDAGHVCLGCGVVLFEVMIEPLPERKLILRMNISNQFGSQFQHWTDSQCIEAEKLYLKLSTELVFKGRYRRAICLVIDYLFQSKKTCSKFEAFDQRN
jgi:hypothetical protein